MPDELFHSWISIASQDYYLLEPQVCLTGIMDKKVMRWFFTNVAIWLIYIQIITTFWTKKVS